MCVCVCVCSRSEASEICVRQVHSRHRYYHTHKYTQGMLQTPREHRHTQNISPSITQSNFFWTRSFFVQDGNTNVHHTETKKRYPLFNCIHYSMKPLYQNSSAPLVSTQRHQLVVIMEHRNEPLCIPKAHIYRNNTAVRCVPRRPSPSRSTITKTNMMTKRSEE